MIIPHARLLLICTFEFQDLMLIVDEHGATGLLS
jgi:hypothetical protein